MDLSSLLKLVERSAQRVYEQDKDLIGLNGNEQSVVFRFALYLDQALQAAGYLNDGLVVDLEYTKNVSEPKRIHREIANSKGGNTGIRPDVLLHKRKSNEQNILVVECKRYSEKDDEDFRKLEAMTSDRQFLYKLGCFINFDDEKPHFSYFQNGEKVKESEQVIL